MISPQCPREDEWKSERQQALLVALLDHMANTWPIDRARVYLTGLSMGGYGSWRLAADHADRFAAVIPICGGGQPADAAKLKDLPIWVFHGMADTVVLPERSTEMVDAIKKAGGTKIKYTTYEEIGHNSWSATYAMDEVFSWMQQQKRGD